MKLNTLILSTHTYKHNKSMVCSLSFFLFYLERPFLAFLVSHNFTLLECVCLCQNQGILAKKNNIQIPIGTTFGCFDQTGKKTCFCLENLPKCEFQILGQKFLVKICHFPRKISLFFKDLLFSKPPDSFTNDTLKKF